jgi:hypothetical protein
MTAAVLEGVGLTMVAGIMSGNCMLPSKFARKWKWEHLWFVFSVVSLLILPWGLALLLVDYLFAATGDLPPRLLSLRLPSEQAGASRRFSSAFRSGNLAWALRTRSSWG